MHHTRRILIALIVLFLPWTAALSANTIDFLIDDIEIFYDGAFQPEKTREIRFASLGEVLQIQFLASGNVIRLLEDNDPEGLLCERTTQGVLADEYLCDSPGGEQMISIRKAARYVYGAVMNYVGPTGWPGDSDYVIRMNLKRK